MPDIQHDFPIKAHLDKVYRGLVTQEGLEKWWAKSAKGKPATGEEYALGFGPDYDWRAVVSKCVPNKAFEWTMTRSDPDWQGSKVGFELEQKEGYVHVRFYHTGWPANNEHYRTSTYCWAMYLRILKRYLEFGEVVEYEVRLEV